MRYLLLIAFLGIFNMSYSQTWSQRLGIFYEIGDTYQLGEWARSVESHPLGSIVVYHGNDSTGYNKLNSDVLNFDGEIIYNNEFLREGSSYYSSWSHSLIETSNSSYWYTGPITIEFGSPPLTGLYLTNIDLLGDTIVEYWIQADTTGKAGYNIALTSDNHFVLCGNADGGGHGDMFLKKVSMSGEELWTQYYNKAGMSRDYATCVIETWDGGFLLGGLTDKPPLDLRSNNWIVKTDAEGNMEWDLEIGDDEICRRCSLYKQFIGW